MATQLFLLEEGATIHRGTNSANLIGSNVGWLPRALGLARGDGVVASSSTATVAGTTLGVEITTSNIATEWISEPVAADVTISGTITANIWAQENNMSANVAINVVIDIIRANAFAETGSSNTIVEIVRSTSTTELGFSGSNTVFNFTTGMTSGYTPQTLNRGDRLRIRVFGDDAGTMASGFTFLIGYDGTTAAADGDSYVTFTENITFESAPGTALVAIEQNVGEGLGSFGLAGSQNKGQSFTAVGAISKISLPLFKFGAPTDNVVVELQSDSGGAPSGTVLASGTVAGSSLSTTGPGGAYVDLNIAYSTVASTVYWITARRSGSLDTVNAYSWDVTTSSVYAGGTATGNDDGTGWVAISTWDFRFRVYGPVPSSTVVYLTDTASAVPGYIDAVTDNVSVNVGTTPQQQQAQSFVAGGTLTEVKAWLSKGGSPADNLVVEVQSDSSGSPSGAVVGTVATVAASSLTTTHVQTTLTCSIALTAGTTYWLVFRRSGSLDAANRPLLDRAATVASWGVWKTFDGATWGSTGAVLALKITSARDPLMREAWTSRGSGVVNDVTNTAAGFTTPIQVTDTAGGTVVDWFTKQLQAVTLTGLAQANIRAREANVSSNASLRCEIARVESDGSSPTVWAAWDISANNTRGGELDATGEAAETINISGDDLAISDGQRLRIRLYGDDPPSVAMGASSTLTVYYNGTSGGASGDSYITFPVTLTEFEEPEPASLGWGWKSL